MPEMPGVFYLIKNVEGLARPQHFLDAVLYACRHQAEKVLALTLRLRQCVFHTITPTSGLRPAKTPSKAFSQQGHRQDAWV